MEELDNFAAELGDFAVREFDRVLKKYPNLEKYGNDAGTLAINIMIELKNIYDDTIIPDIAEKELSRFFGIMNSKSRGIKIGRRPFFEEPYNKKVDFVEGESFNYALNMAMEKESDWDKEGTYLVIGYGDTFENNMKRMMNIRDILPELLIFTAKYPGITKRSRRIKEYNNNIVETEINNLYRIYKTLCSSFSKENLLGFSNEGMLEIRFIDPSDNIKDQYYELIAVDAIINTLNKISEDIYYINYHSEDTLAKRWNYAKNKIHLTSYINEFPLRSELWHQVFDMLGNEYHREIEIFSQKLGM